MILLTGKPNTGKTTAIKSLIAMIGQRRCGGFFTNEIRNEEGQRIGFETNTLSHKKFLLAHVDFDSPYQIEEFKVNVKGVEDIAVEDMLNDTTHDFMVIDEIGKMQMFSDKFKDAVLKLANSDKRIIATITLDDTDFSRMLKEDPRNSLFTLTLENRDQMPITMARAFLLDDEVYLSKLILSDKYHHQRYRFHYEGDKVILHSTHDIRIITKDEDGYHCTCPYFQENGTCSHIVAIVRNNILRLKEYKF